LLFSRQFHSGGWPYDRARQFMAGQFAEVWDEPTRRDALAAAMSKDLAVGVRLSDASDETIGSYGPTCSRGIETAIEKDARRLGTVTVCQEWVHGPGFLLPIVV